ncbi:hypothetical protein ANCDUO_25638 [Ancylostoma duodenale]|uniref:Uncharacterized protein n=1 Tax=Ancylostoma duodenale TaxID=51022 RepID=A0A0C2C3R7_9BILA|nr:hypothetical protein ANCDUO_25638 [Ancylostoma duodenale]
MSSTGEPQPPPPPPPCVALTPLTYFARVHVFSLNFCRRPAGVWRQNRRCAGAFRNHPGPKMAEISVSLSVSPNRG